MMSDSTLHLALLSEFVMHVSMFFVQLTVCITRMYVSVSLFLFIFTLQHINLYCRYE